MNFIPESLYQDVIYKMDAFEISHIS